MKTVQEVAADIARELREHPERWTQAFLAKAANGASVLVNDPCASSWCILGHIKRRTVDSSQRFSSSVEIAWHSFDLIAEKYIDDELANWNDASSRTVADVIALCDKVAAS